VTADSSNGRALPGELERWESTTLKKALDRGGERQGAFATTSTDARRLYTPLDVAGLDYDRDLGMPGQYPYTRGVQETMYRGRLWTMRQYAGFGTARESNERFKFLLGQGQSGLSVAFDLPTQIGLDSDDPNASAEIGQVGVAIDSLADMEEMFDGIPLDRVSTSMTINAPASVLVAMYMAVAEKQGVPAGDIMGTAQNDVLKEYVARGTYIYPPRPSLRLAADLITYCAKYAPKFNSISVSGYHIRDAGATAAQEVGFAFSNAIAYIEACQRSGVSVDDVAPRISWIFNTHNNFFEEVAKYRALRRMWARLLRERFGAKDPNSWKLRTHIQTGGATLTAQQAQNNIVRAAVQALASVLGGVQSIALSCYDEALAIPTEEAQRIALRTQQMAREYMDRVEDMGGSVAAIESGYMQGEIQEAAVAQQQAIESGERVVVGVNRFRTGEEPEPTIFRVNTEVAQAQIERLRRVRAERDQQKAIAVLERLDASARGEENLMPAILDAVKAYATLGEICGVLKTAWGDYRPPTVV
jgi:methylmalonyl-CoA mutase N-terminal domain/subunit